jgi:hypothetical protein
MAIRTVHGIVNGQLARQDLLKQTGTIEAVGIYHSLLYAAGRPGAGVAPSPGIAGAALTSYAGQIPHADAPALQQTYLALFEAVASQPGTLLVCDRLWHNSGIAVATTTPQTVNSVALPARDRLGAVDGDGVLLGLEVSTATTNAGAISNTTVSYTNSAGTAGRTGSILSFPATAIAGTFVPFNLQAGDLGVRSVQSVTLGTSYAAGAIHLVAYRVLGALGLPVPSINGKANFADLGFPRLFDGTVPYLIWIAGSTTATTQITGGYAESQG